MDQPMPQDQQMPPGAPPAPMPADPSVDPSAQPTPDNAGPQFGETVQATDAEQAQYERFIANAYELTYGDAMLPKVMDMLKGEGDPVEGLARVTALIITRVMGAAEQAGEKLSGDVMLHAGTAVFEDLANLSTKAGIHDFEQDKDSMEGAFFRALDQLRTMLQESGKLDQQAAAKDLDALMQADQGGKLEGIFRGLAQQDQGGTDTPDAGSAPQPTGMPTGGLMPQGAN